MAGELVERLRNDVHAHELTGNGGMRRVEAVREAADRIEALERENATLRAERDEARKALGVSETEIQSAIENVRWVMQNLPIGFVMREECPVDMLMHAIGVLSAATIRNMGGEG